MKLAKTLLVGMISLCGLLASAQTSDEIIAKHVESLGGKDKMAALKSTRMTGTMNAQGNDISIVLSKVHQVGMRMDLDIMGSSNYQVMNEKSGWAFFPVMGMTEPKEMDEPQFKSGVNQLDVQGALVNYKDKGTTVELLGTEEVDGAEAHKFKLTYKNGHSSTYYIDKKTNRHVKTVSKSVANGNEMVVETTFSDFKQNADGYWFPYTVTNAQGTISFEKIETNVAIDSKLFTN